MVGSTATTFPDARASYSSPPRHRRGFVLHWRYLIPFLTHKYTVIAVDLPGLQVKAASPRRATDSDEQADRLAGFLRALAVENTFVVGNSMGGNIALWMALQFPDLCRGCGRDRTGGFRGALSRSKCSAGCGWLIRCPT